MFFLISTKRATSSTVHTARQPDDVISVLAGPLKRRLAGLICMFTQPVVQPAVFIQMPLYSLLYNRPQSVNTVSNYLRFAFLNVQSVTFCVF